MRQPKAAPATEEIAEFLRFAVPLCSADLIARMRRYYGDDTATARRWLAGIATRGGIETGHGGDGLQYPGKGTRDQRRRAVTAQALAEAVAAAGLLAGPDGLTVLGAHVCPTSPCPHPEAQEATV